MDDGSGMCFRVGRSRTHRWLSGVPKTPKAARPVASGASSTHTGRPAQIGNRADLSIAGSVVRRAAAVIHPGACTPC
jgi:hypothetical protein